MKIALNCIFFQPRGGGIKEYIYNLVGSLAQIDQDNDYVLYVLQSDYDYARQHLPIGPRMRLKKVPFGTGFREVVRRSLLSHRFWLKEEQEEGFDIFHSPFFHAPKLRRAKVIITVHDLRFYRYPSTYTLPRYLFLRHAVKSSIAHADRIITISSFTKSEIMDAYHTPGDKITVVLEAINRSDFHGDQLEGFQLPEEARELQGARFLLSVGHIEPRKNYDRLLDAFDQLKQKPEAADLKLVIVGKKGHHYQNTLERIERTPDVLYLNFVSRELLLWLYKEAALFVFPSYYEGFGFPPLEAACMGTISSVARISSMPEVCGDSVDYFDPFDTEDMCQSLHRCLYDSATIERLEQALEPNLARFSWTDNAQATKEIYSL